MRWEIFGIPQGATYGNLRENRVTVIGVSLLWVLLSVRLVAATRNSRLHASLDYKFTRRIDFYFV